MSWLYDASRSAYWRMRGLPLAPLVLAGHTGTIWSVGFLPDGKQVISGSADMNVRAWRVEDGDEVGTVVEGEGVVMAVSASGDEKWIATAGAEKIITIWNATTHEKVVELEGHSGPGLVCSLGFSPDSARLVSGSADGTIIIWSTTTGKQLAGPLKGHTSKVDCVECSPNGEEIASCDGQDLRIWHSHTSKALLPPIPVKARSLGWTPNGQQLIAGCDNGYIKFFDPSTGSEIAQWKGHNGIIHSISISGNGNFFASGSQDKTVRLWDTTTRQQISPPLQHDSYVYSVAISRDGRHLASGGEDNHARIWSLIGVLPQCLLENAPTSTTSTCNAPADVGVEPPQVPNPSLEKAQVTQLPDDKIVETESESSSLRDFLDRPAVAYSIGEAEDPSDRVYSNFFKPDSTDAPPPVDEPPKRRVFKFLDKFTWEKKNGGLGQTKTQPEPGAGAEAEFPADLTTKERKEPYSDPTPADENYRASTPTHEPKPAASPPHTKRQVRSRVTRSRRTMMRRERQEHAYVAESRDRPIFAWETGPLPDEIERGCCFHLASYICYGQRDPNINPSANNAQPITQPIPSPHGVAPTNSRSLGARLDRLLVRLHLRKLPPASASLLAIVPPISSPHADPGGALAPTPISLPTQSPPTIMVTSPTGITEALVHPSTPPTCSCQTSSPPPVLLPPASVDPNIDADGAPYEIEPNPWQITDTEWVDFVSVKCMAQLDLANPWNNA